MLEEVWATLETTSTAAAMRESRWGYAAVSGLHVLGVALLVGASSPLALRLLGFWPSVPIRALHRVLSPIAAGGLALAVACGGLLFLAAPADYAALRIFQIKLALIAAGASSAFATSVLRGVEAASSSQRRIAGAVSLLCWTLALVFGRLIAFVD